MLIFQSIITIIKHRHQWKIFERQVQLYVRDIVNVAYGAIYLRKFAAIDATAEISNGGSNEGSNEKLTASRLNSDER